MKAMHQDTMTGWRGEHGSTLTHEKTSHLGIREGRKNQRYNIVTGVHKGLQQEMQIAFINSSCSNPHI